ncbi:pilus assembly FimT family protein [Paucibacter sp. XJ19-41]|uniref:pilus assembly FimT family protein n=1 Tax=Paucibacter sp. XJ19-41 TaxID=2927824 RepID=UPI00234A454F|nr:prepilin-type N-terminal cleavage/methylation domain-containing protein [Paucibacter sp. XJ19-41]MDC6165857.1 prepilin-type N-terminal cleavage/methylation domain-containing protein [Paucibacter sp. XJ19-41]
MNASRIKGLSLIELLVVVAVLGIVLAVATPSLTDLMNKRRVQLIANELSTDLAYARSEGGLRNKRTGMTFRSSNTMSCYTIQVFLAARGCDCTKGAGVACDGNIELRTTQIPSLTGVSLVLGDAFVGEFKNLDFTAPLRIVEPAPSAIRVVGNRGYILEVRISVLGRVLICSPDGKFGGVQPC